MSDVKINPNIRPIQPAKEQDALRRPERTGATAFDDTMAEITKGSQAAKGPELDKPITDRASLNKALEQAATAQRDMMRVKELLEQQAARIQSGNSGSSNDS